jgi:hypothetical protein
LQRKFLLDHVTEEKKEGIRCQQLLDDLKEKDKILEFERGSLRSPSLENSLWKRL